MNMRPTSERCNSVDRGNCNSEQLGDARARFPARFPEPYFYNLIWNQFGHSVPFSFYGKLWMNPVKVIISAWDFFRMCSSATSAACCPPPFRRAIVRIIGHCAREKVAWVYARFVVAFVQNECVIWNLPKRNNERNTMSENNPPVHVESSVPLWIAAVSPYPALSKVRSMWLNWAVFVHLAPKSCEKLFRNNHKAFLSVCGLRSVQAARSRVPEQERQKVMMQLEHYMMFSQVEILVK